MIASVNLGEERVDHVLYRRRIKNNQMFSKKKFPKGRERSIYDYNSIVQNLGKKYERFLYG